MPTAAERNPKQRADRADRGSRSAERCGEFSVGQLTQSAGRVRRGRCDCDDVDRAAVGMQHWISFHAFKNARRFHGRSTDRVPYRFLPPRLRTVYGDRAVYGDAQVCTCTRLTRYCICANMAPILAGIAETFCPSFLARDLIYTSRAYATMSVSVCLSVCL